MTGVKDTGSKFIADVVDTSHQFMTGVKDTGGKFIAGVKDTDDKIQETTLACLSLQKPLRS